MMRCSSAKFEERTAAIDAKRKLLRVHRLWASVKHCESCDKYHLVAEMPRPEVSKKWTLVLQCLAQGYRDSETSRIVLMTPRSVERSIAEMIKRFSALSRPHLVAIAIALGMIDPNDFVPQEGEHDAAARHA